MDPAERNAGWREYWHADRPASCVPADPATAQKIGAAWVEWFRALPDGTRILDVATGNGIVLALASVAAQEASRRFVLTGIDLAPIDPLAHLVHPTPGLRAARFLAGIAAESMPFEDAAFDVVVSQYGLEYAALDPALREVHRVLAPGGRLRWLAHDADSDVVAQNAVQAEEVDFLLAGGGVIDAARAYVEALARPGESAAPAPDLERRLADAERFCRARPAAHVVSQVCSELKAVVARPAAYRPADLVRMVDDGERQLRAHRARIAALNAAVLTPPRLHQVEVALAPPAWHAFRTDRLAVGSTAGGIGRWIEATRAAL